MSGTVRLTRLTINVIRWAAAQPERSRQGTRANRARGSPGQLALRRAAGRYRPWIAAITAARASEPVAYAQFDVVAEREADPVVAVVKRGLGGARKAVADAGRQPVK